MTDRTGQKFWNEYLLEKRLRDYRARSYSKKAARKRLEDAGIETYDAGYDSIGYRFTGGCAILFSTLPEDIDRVIRVHGFVKHEPIVLVDTWKRVWNWIKS